jgi:tRNA threonylcarbamoyladenosine biosynthesis protein TsaE
LYNVTSALEADTAALVKRLLPLITPGTCVVLNGELGAGKTFFVKCLAAEFGVPRVSSPTFALVNVYEAASKLYHFDFYRIRSADELFDIGLFEMLNDENGIVLIEWANLFPEVLPKQRLEIAIEIGQETDRIIKVSRYE